MGKLAVGVSSPAVKIVQQKLNEAYKGSVVAETGEFDENTAGAVSRFQATAGLPQSGAVDDATLKALFWAAKDKREIKYNGKTYYIGYPDEYNLLSAKLIKKAEAQTTYYLNMARGVRGMWDAHRDARNNNKFFAFIVDEATGVNFPAESVITAAENGAKSIVGAAKSNDYKAFQDALDSGSKAIRQANADMNQYRDELYSGSEKLIEELNDIKEGCVVTLEISAAIATGGSSVAVTAAVMGGLGSYKALLSEIDKASTKTDVKVGDAFGNILLAGVIEASVGAIMKGKGDAFAKAVAAKVSGAALKRVGSEALAVFIERAIEGGAKKAAEEALKDICKACNPKDKMTVEQALENAAKNFVKGALLGQLEGVLGGFSKNAGKIFSAKDFEGLGKVDLNKALKEGGQKVLEISYDKNAPAALKAADGDPAKVQTELKSRMVEDPAVQKWFTDYGKKQEKKDGK